MGSTGLNVLNLVLVLSVFLGMQDIRQSRILKTISEPESGLEQLAAMNAGTSKLACTFFASTASSCQEAVSQEKQARTGLGDPDERCEMAQP